MIELHCEQRSDEWHAARLGVITASACADIFSDHKKYKFVYKILAERLTGKAEKFVCTEPMQHGIDTEDTARLAYEKATGNAVQEIGFVFRDEDKLAGCSPDGLVGEDGLVEIKCPMTKTHLGYINSGPPKMYKDQMQFQMYCTGRQWCDFVTFDDRIGREDLQMKITRVDICPATQISIHNGVQWVQSRIEAFLKKNPLPEGKEGLR